MRRSFHFGIAAGFDDEDDEGSDDVGFGYSSLLHRRRSRVVNVSCSGLVLRRLAAVVTDVASLHPNDGDDDISAFLPSFPKVAACMSLKTNFRLASSVCLRYRKTEGSGALACVHGGEDGGAAALSVVALLTSHFSPLLSSPPFPLSLDDHRGSTADVISAFAFGSAFGFSLGPRPSQRGRLNRRRRHRHWN